MNKRTIGVCALMGLLALGACKKDDEKKPSNSTDEEVITRIDLWAIKNGTTDTLKFVNRPEDNVPGLPKQEDQVTLAANSSYTFLLRVWNEAANPDVLLNQEIQDEGTRHQFFYRVTPSSLLTVPLANFDKDANGRIIGLRVTNVTTGNTGTGELKLKLKHDLNKAVTSVQQGDDSAGGGSTDAEVEWPLTIQ